MTRIPLWVEPYAGSLAVGLRLLGCRKPLVGWMGGKSGYADAIMQVLDVSAADEVWCADVGDWAQVWRALALPGVAREAADIVDSYEADALSTGDCPASYRRVWMALREDWRREGTTADAVGVARWVALVKGSAMQRGPEAGTKLPDLPAHRRHPRDFHPVAERWAPYGKRLRALPDPLPVRIWGCASAIPARRAVVMLDPPYAETEGYRHGIGQHTRADAIVERDRWRAAGATVAMCEQVHTGGVPYDLAPRRNGCGRMHGGKRAKTGEVLSVYWPRMPEVTLWSADALPRVR